MIRPCTRPALLLAASLILAACRTETAQDLTPQELTPETLGHYCQMNLLEHPGPKAQVHLEGMPVIFFSQVRDAIAYARAPEQVAPILALQVNDMGADRATWDQPGAGNWIAADAAFFVVGSAREGGMGAPETVPFADLVQAEGFARSEGGQVLRLDQITDAMVLTPVETGEPGADQTQTDADFEDRLRALSHPKRADP